MNNSTSRKLSTLTIALPLTIIPSTVAQSNVNGKVTDVTINDGLIIGNHSPAVFAQKTITGMTPSARALSRDLATLAFGKDSIIRIGDIDVKGHSVLSTIGSKNPEVQSTLKCSDPAMSAENIALSSATGLYIGDIRSEITRFNGTAVSPTVASPLGGNIAVKNNSVVRATLTDVTITTNSAKRSDSISNDVRVGDTVIK